MCLRSAPEKYITGAALNRAALDRSSTVTATNRYCICALNTDRLRRTPVNLLIVNSNEYALNGS
jgi:hypothetical protein